jgi:hypothetical protein
MNTKNFVGKLNMITIKMMGKEFILSLMCFNDIIQTYDDHFLLFSKELFFQVQNYVKRFMKISMCDDSKYFPLEIISQMFFKIIFIIKHIRKTRIFFKKKIKTK